MNIGIISFAHMHAYSYAASLCKMQDVNISGIYDEDEERGQQAADTFNTVFLRSLNDLLALDIDAVVICSENAKHKEHVIRSASAKKHILCEKPLSVSQEDAIEMIEAVRQHQVFLQVAFPVRFNTSIVEAKEIIDAGKIGEVLAVKGTNRGTSPGGWFVDKALSGGGAVIDHTVHVVDIIRWVLKTEITEVYAEVDHAFTDDDIDDCGMVTLQCENGAFATLDCSWSRNPTFPTWGDVTMEFVGSKGTLSVDAFKQDVKVYDENGVSWEYWGDDMDFLLLEHFIHSLREGKRPEITEMDGMRALEVALAAYQSSDTHQPVALDRYDN